MAAFSPKSTPTYNVRSVPTPLKAETVLGRLSSLGEIYKSIEDLLNLPMTQQALLQHQNEKKADNIFEGSLLLNPSDHLLSAIVRVLSEASLITVSIFTSLLLFLSVPMLKPRPSKWYLVSKLVHKGVLPCEGQQENLNELESVDAALANLVVPSSGKDFEAREIHSVQQRLEILHASIEEVENELDSLFRHFIHARVSLLNILSQ
ncbi:BPS1-LIKE PROTEIN [Salix purpurea]|uniref:BPS1-LIKE PROTEIN n=1 Tax=Salix purpurea TaxID=77065 RepID=A0A9Q0WWB0_SALPP|nr:BPS1-LIKE PROTEIN [Salix purpurea]